MAGLVEFNPEEIPGITKGKSSSALDAVGAGFTSAFEQGTTAEGQRHSRTYGAGWRNVFDRVAQGHLKELPDDLRSRLFEQGFTPDDALLGDMRGWIEENPQLGLPLTDDMRADAVDARRQANYAGAIGRIEEAEETLSRAGPARELTGRLVGGVGAEFLDPLNLATAPVGASARMGLLATVAIEGAVNAGIEGLDTENRNAIARKLGMPETNAAMNMVIGGLFGGTLGGSVKGAQMGLRSLSGAGRALDNPKDKRAVATALQSSSDDLTRGVAQQVLRDVEETEAAVTNVSRESLREHAERGQEAASALSEGREPNLPDRPHTAIPARSIVNGQIEEVDPRDLLVQPETFQFKSEGSRPGGVTGKLSDVSEWRPERAGVVMVFEYGDGSRAIADGHQRTDLARRIMDADPSQDIRMAAVVFREADGYTPENVRMLAALKNISEAADGMSNALARDAAKVLRIDPEALRQLPAGPGIARAQSLSRLSDDAFQLLINGVVPDRFAEAIGRLVEDPRMHEPMMRLLEKSAPDTTQQAEAIVRQALASPIEQRTMSDLFGDREVAESLYLERAKVLERATRMIRDDRKTFQVLTEREKAITGAGNKLDRASNAVIRKRLEEALTAIDRLAYRAGPISEALNDGAKAYKGSGRLADAAAGVVDAIRDELSRNGLSGTGARTGGSAREPQAASANAPDFFQGFDDPIAGPGVTQQIAATRIDRPNLEAAPEGRNDQKAELADLKRLVDAGADRATIDAHPAVQRALAEMQARAERATNLAEVYDTPEWHSSRQYVFGKEEVTGTDAALPKWVDQAERFAGAAGPLREKRLTIVLGPPAAGKSTIAEELATVKRAAILDADEIKGTLPEFEGGIGAAAVHEESSDLSALVGAALRDDGTNVVLPKVGGSPGSVRETIAAFREAGYSVELVNMAVTKENAYRRMIGRFVAKGRLIDPKYVDAVGDNPSQTYRTIKKEGLADGYAELDNNGQVGTARPVTDLSGENPLSGSSLDIREGGSPEPEALGRGAGDPRAPEEGAGAGELTDLVPLSREVDAESGEIITRTMTRDELAADLDAEDEFVEALGICLK